MPFTLGSMSAGQPETIAAQVRRLAEYLNQMEAAYERLRQTVLAATPLTLPQIQQALQVGGSHPLNVTGLPGTLRQNQPHTTP